MVPEHGLAAAFERIKRWMIDNGAPLLVENLAPGASLEDIAQTEMRLGFSIPADLRALWLLHDGQVDGGNGFFEHFGLYSMAQAVAERELLFPFAELPSVGSLQLESELPEEGVDSNEWIPFAGIDSDGLAVSTVSGNVFEFADGLSDLEFVADSISAWATAYATRVLAGDYCIEEGFGDYYLALRDREAEERERREREEVERRATMPLPELLAEAIARNDERLCYEGLARAQAESPKALSNIVTLLFRSPASPEFIAASLRLMLDNVILSAAQWSVVAEGGAQLGNNAIRNFALARMKVLGWR